MKNIIRTLGSIISSETFYLVVQILLGMWAVDNGNYTLAYGIGLLTILSEIKTHKSDSTSN
jgi:hypothetical protein